MSYLIIFIIGAIAYRARGGGLNKYEKSLLGYTDENKMPSRYRELYWVISCSISILYATMDALIGFLSIPLLIAGCIGYFGGHFNLADPANRNLKNYLRLTIAGMSTAAPLMLGLMILQHYGLYSGACAWGGVVSGMLFAPCYLIYFKIINTKIVQALGEFGNVGELLIGGATLVGIIATI